MTDFDELDAYPDAPLNRLRTPSTQLIRAGKKHMQDIRDHAQQKSHSIRARQRCSITKRKIIVSLAHTA